MEVFKMKSLCLLVYIFSLIPFGTSIINPDIDKGLTTLTKSEKYEENISQKDLETIIKSNSPVSSESEKENTKSLEKPLEEAVCDIKKGDSISGGHIISAYAPEFKPVRKSSFSYISPGPGKLSGFNHQSDSQNLQSSWVLPGCHGIPQIIAVECPSTSIPSNAQLVEMNPLILNQVLEQHNAKTLGMQTNSIAKNNDEPNELDMHHDKNMRSSELKDSTTENKQINKSTFGSSPKIGNKDNKTPMHHSGDVGSSGSDYIHSGGKNLDNPTFESSILEDYDESSFPPLPINPGLPTQAQKDESTAINEGAKSTDISGQTDHKDTSKKDAESVKRSGKNSKTDADTSEEQKSWKKVLQQATLQQPQNHKGKNVQKMKGSDSGFSSKSIWPMSVVNSNKNAKGLDGGLQMPMKYSHAGNPLSQEWPSKDHVSHLFYDKTNVVKEKEKDTLYLDFKNFGRSARSSLDAGAQSKNSKIPSEKKLPDLGNIGISRPKDVNQQAETDQTIGSDFQEKTNKGKLLSSGNEWITPKKTIKHTKVSNVEFSPSSIEVGGPGIHPKFSETPQTPIEMIQGLKTVARHSKNKKKSKGKGKPKGKAVPVDDDDWDIETLDSRSGNPAEEKDTEHESFIKYVQDELQNYFVPINDLEDAKPSWGTIDQPTIRIILEDFLSINNHTPLLKLELKSQSFDILYDCEKRVPSLYNKDYWTFEIYGILKHLDGVSDEELMRRRGAFFVQYFKRRESKILDEQEHSLSVKLRNLANLLKCRNPFEVFVNETEDEIDTLLEVVDSMDHSEYERLKELCLDVSFYQRFFMVDIRQVELRNSCSEGFFGEEFLQNVLKQGLKIDSIRLLEVSLELSTPIVSWKELSADAIQTKYTQVLSALADAPCARPEITKSYCLSEADLYSRNRHWVGSQTQNLLISDSHLWDHVIKRIKLLLSALKGKEARTLREIAGEEHTVDSAHKNELIFYDEAFAAFFIGLSLSDVAWIKYYQRTLKSSPSFKGRNHKNGVYWPKTAAKAVVEFEAFKCYYQLLGKMLLLEK
ncbi:uncharacterized protein MELLADRAFT_69360 [Melampsora larici-populina 98AG31]|uniref:Secreted protein n=1 Tax=Melampsora larici-populina (strain 98AG31 / pathotype 3-4-7) TaxID=747676 RepID=F4SAF4_MELLP|nr:uncharacterized protein MELLADRAFT_69360 [Melampsora larici-populina 98AG31]EGF98378.1 hypothetical protein MELLADRAFT_69360 [Melampsora larici-populina 98AG31]